MPPSFEFGDDLTRPPLRRQLLLAFFCAALAIAFVSGKIVERLEKEYLTSNFQRHTEDTLELLSAASVEALIAEDQPVLETIARQATEKDDSIGSIRIENESGTVLTDVAVSGIGAAAQTTFRSKSVAYLGETFGTVSIVWSLDRTYAEIERHSLIIASFVASALVVLMGTLAFGLQLLVTGPVSVINRHLIALARVTASEHGRSAPGYAESRELLKL